MRTKILMVSLVASLLSSAVNAQTWKNSSGIQYQLSSCSRENATSTIVNCDVLGTYEGDEAFITRVAIASGNDGFTAVAPTGDTYIADRVTWSGQSDTVVEVRYLKGVPVKMTYRLSKVPISFPSFAGLTVQSGTVRNVPIRGSATPTPVTLPAAATPTQVIRLENTEFNAVMTNCKVSGAAIVCTATMTPRK